MAAALQSPCNPTLNTADAVEGSNKAPRRFASAWGGDNQHTNGADNASRWVTSSAKHKRLNDQLPLHQILSDSPLFILCCGKASV
jgi:hypothetical protein